MREYKFNIDDWTGGNQKLEKIKKSFNDLNDLIRRPTGLLQLKAESPLL